MCVSRDGREVFLVSSYKDGQDAFTQGKSTSGQDGNFFSGWLSEALKVQQNTLNAALPTTPPTPSPFNNSSSDSSGS